MPPREWLPGPPRGTRVCGGFDGSDVDDWTGIRLETAAGWQFTPRWSSTGEAMIWNPAQHGGRIPREQVHDAWADIATRWSFVRVYCDPGFNDPTDPTSWLTEIQRWATLYGEKVFIGWQMAGNTRVRAVHAALVRMEADLRTRALRHDGCPVTTRHVEHARRVAKPGDRYVIGKPSQHQKIDLAATAVLCHEAACDATAAGEWATAEPEYAYV